MVKALHKNRYKILVVGGDAMRFLLNKADICLECVKYQHKYNSLDAKLVHSKFSDSFY